MENDIILKTNSISIGYRDKKNITVIAKNIDIELQKGKLIALIGVNGIGKSTLLKTLTKIQKPIEGSVQIFDKDLQKYSNTDLAFQMSLVLTEPLPPSNLTVFELVALGRQPYTNWLGTLTDDDKIKINTAINQTQIAHLIEKKHHEISDGQLQKVLIARALAQDTPLIILDEPTTHLDLLHKYTLLQLLKKLAVENQKCILFSTHDIDLAIQLCDQIIIMTPEETVQGQPCQLIENGIFNTIFDDKSIDFDTEKGKFIFRNS
ncbi:ABC transporter ATP-binding protein [Flavobacterium sp.]|uniref:ABC transporter ATP-binding protein n=1 Tax=Flavobacterium sp. TaxID=239 RepID=UPI002609BB7D|nr:ABC transporter ATP-binding protein [Flavobacterium sp.]MDD3003888.1 ABC transporter ATP-binding protein [Flavobacterium sp.]